MLRRIRHPNTVKFLLSIDIGTTYTAASYCVFSGRDNAPIFYEINRWPKQTVGDAKVPSVLYYDRDKVPRLHGAETEDESSLMEAEQEHWEKAEWWKLRLRPEYLTFPPGFTMASLPEGITVDDVFKDQMAYVKENVRASVIKSFGDGEKIWDQFRSSMYVILTTPNGWEGRHQNRMRMQP
ncbi:unnamed protein product [Cyclocybe aegerita]|uniref:Uncharacterized protein n=1 Tax=Cyclocybe aegerita TaxID=1973307 RepID=A0A8S0XJJ7_CYCAE|nr:unnamed protein product [Cyclocybe aegerita]